MEKCLDHGEYTQHCQYFEEFWTQKRAEINEKDDNELTSLQWASQKGHLDIVKCLIENGADIQLWNTDFSMDGINWTTPIHFAAQEGYHDVVEYLLNFFDVDLWDKGAILDQKCKLLLSL